MGSDTNRPVFVIFVKAAQVGRVKTRLTAALSAEQAVAVHAAMMEATLARVLARPAAARVLAVAPDESRERFAADHHDFDDVIPQGSGDFGQRIARTVAHVHRKLPRPLILLGADAPDLPDDRLARAAEIVCAGGWALCPSRDGGYCLLGLARPEPRLLTGIDWGSQRVAEQTRTAARNIGLPLTELEPWHDVDTPRDLERLIARLAGAEDPHLRRLHTRLLSAKLKPPMDWSAPDDDH